MSRKSVREFKDIEIPESKIESLLKAGMQAPSVNNQQPWNFIVVNDRVILDELSKMSRGSWPLGTSPIAIIPVMLETIKSPKMRTQDMSAATQNILLEAVEQGLGGVWIGVHPIDERVKFVSQLLHTPEDVTPFCIIALGVPKNKAEIIERYDSSRVHYNSWMK
jgi:nitroreductase